MNETIYSTVPVERKVDSDKTTKLISFLKENKGRFYTAKELAKECGFATNGTQVEVRFAIANLISEGNPIISCDSGFALAIHKNQIQKYIETLQHRQQGITRRINDLSKIYELWQP